MFRIEGFHQHAVSRQPSPRPAERRGAKASDTYNGASRAAVPSKDARIHAAIERTNAALANARRSDEAVASLQRALKSSPHLRFELQEARTTASNEWAKAAEAARAELRTRELLGASPAHTQRRRAELAATRAASHGALTPTADKNIDSAHRATTAALAEARRAQESLETTRRMLKDPHTSRMARKNAEMDLPDLAGTASRAWARAGQLAAAEVAVVHETQGAEAAEALSADYAAAETNETFRGYATGATQKSASAARVSHAATSIDEAYKRGGIKAAEPELKTQLDNAQTPEEVAAILDRVHHTIEKMVDDVHEHYCASEEDTDLWAPSRELFQTLGTAVDRVSRSSSADARRSLDKVVDTIANMEVEDREWHTFEDAMMESVGELGTASPLVERVISRLKARGEQDVAETLELRFANQVAGVLPSGPGGGELQTRSFETAKAAYDDAQKNLQWLIGTYGPLMTKPQLESAVQAFMEKNHEVYDNFSRQSGALVKSLASLQRMSDAATSDDEKELLQKAIKKLAEKLPSALATDAGGAALAAEATGLLEGESLVDHLEEIASTVEQPKEWLESVGGALVKGTTGLAQRAVAAGRFDKAEALIGSLSKHAHLFGVDEETMNAVEGHLTSLVRGDATLAERMAAQAALENSLNEVDALSLKTPLGQSFRAAGALLGIIGAASSARQAFQDPSVLNVANALLGTGTAGVQTGQFLAALEADSVLLEGGLASAEKAFGVLGGLLQGAEAMAAFGRGDLAAATISGTGALGSLLLAAGATGPGLVVSGVAFVADLAYGQYQKVQMSNAHETDDSRAFLEGAGVPEGVADHLIDCDSDGRAPGPVLAALADRMGIDRSELLTAINHLSADDVLSLVHTIHGVDYSVNDEGEMEMPMHADNDWKFGIGQRPAATGRSAPYEGEGPESLPALENWFRTWSREHGMSLPAAA